MNAMNPEKNQDAGHPVLRLRKGEDRRLRAGHLWIFSNEVDTAQTPLDGFQPGQLVDVHTSQGKCIGTAYANPNSLICARLLARQGGQPIDGRFLLRRLQQALALRERCYPAPYYRLVYGESDGLPGLVVDRFGDILVVQCATAGMDRLAGEVVNALEELLSPAGILLKNDADVRKREGLEPVVEVVRGQVPDEVRVEENGAVFMAPLASGQKTGWYYDHGANRAQLLPYVQGARVLDLFSYIGAWGIESGVAGAAEVTCVDASSTALDAVEANAALNSIESKLKTIQGDVFDVLQTLRSEGERFDIVIVDPPAFVKRKKDLKSGSEAYTRLNRLAMQMLPEDGLLLSASCSYHMPAVNLRTALLQASRKIGRRLQIIAQGHQAPDHPIHPAIAETEYLKAFLSRALAG